MSMRSSPLEERRNFTFQPIVQSGDYEFMINFGRQQPEQRSLTQTNHKFKVLVFRIVLN